jgi:hypothetical protein
MEYRGWNGSIKCVFPSSMKEDMVGGIYSRHEKIRNSCNVFSEDLKECILGDL